MKFTDSVIAIPEISTNDDRHRRRRKSNLGEP